jgi:hypothetical protein
MDMTFPTGWPHEDLRGPHVGIEGLLRQRIHGRYFLAAPRIGRDLGARAGVFNPARPLISQLFDSRCITTRSREC